MHEQVQVAGHMEKDRSIWLMGLATSLLEPKQQDQWQLQDCYRRIFNQYRIP